MLITAQLPNIVKSNKTESASEDEFVRRNFAPQKRLCGAKKESQPIAEMRSRERSGRTVS
jgi:hypothetical protein